MLGNITEPLLNSNIILLHSVKPRNSASHFAAFKYTPSARYNYAVQLLKPRR